MGTIEKINATEYTSDVKLFAITKQTTWSQVVYFSDCKKHLENSITYEPSCRKELQEMLTAGKITQRRQGIYQMKAKDDAGEYHYVYGKTEDIVEAKFSLLEQEPCLEKSLDDMEAQLPDGISSSGNGSVLRQYMFSWLQMFKAPPNIRRSSFSRLCYTYKKVAEDEIVGKDIRELTPRDIQSYLNRLYAMADVSNSDKRKRFYLVQSCLTQAVLSGDISANPCASVKFKNQATARGEMKAFTPAEQALLIAGLSQQTNGKPRYRMAWAFILILETGMRIGEAMALEWRDVVCTPRGTFLNIDKNLSRDGCKPLLEPSPKTEAGKRKIPLNARALEAIRQLRAVAADGCPYIMGSKSGGYLQYRNMLTVFQSVCKDVGIPVYGIHALRHSFATNCYNRGVEVKILSKLLGHASTAITYDTYIHLFEEQYVDAMLTAVGM